jgi:hypothetical protein
MESSIATDTPSSLLATTQNANNNFAPWKIRGDHDVLSSSLRYRSCRDGCTLARNIFENRQFLDEQCKAHGNTILRRWKKTKEKRETLLLEVEPQMHPHQCCDVHFSLEFVPVWKANEAKSVPDPDVASGTHRRPHRNVFLTPYINLEALKTDTARFLSLLYNRVKYSPGEWASYDNFLLSLQWREGAFSISYHRGTSSGGKSLGRPIDGSNHGVEKSGRNLVINACRLKPAVRAIR